MRSTTKRLEHLEKRYRTHFEEQSIDAERLLTDSLDLLAARMKASGCWPPRASADRGRNEGMPEGVVRAW